MIDELKNELERTFNRKVLDRGDCEALVQDIYEKTGAVLSYNTLRRMFSLAEYRKPRESTLDQIAVYCGFRSYNDFRQRFSDIDVWPTWERLYVTLASNHANELIELLRHRKARNEHFSLSFTIIVRELLNRKDLEGLMKIFEDPSFQFEQLPYDEVTQLGVLIGLHFRDFDDPILEQQLLLLPNFRNLVVKVFVDYGQLNQKYGRWIAFLAEQASLDEETRTFVTCLDAWRRILLQEAIPLSTMKKIPPLSMEQHPILFGRIFSIKLLKARSRKERQALLEQMTERLALQPHFVTELLYEPALESLVTQYPPLKSFVVEHAHLINDIKFWYHYSQVAIHRVFQVSILISNKQYAKALSTLDNITYAHIRHGYREFVEVYIAFFRLQIAKDLAPQEVEHWQGVFEERRTKLNYPLLSDEYFKGYFVDR